MSSALPGGPIGFLWAASRNRRHGVAKAEMGSSLERAAFTIPEFCFRNSISRPTYHRLRAEGRGPVEMRIGLNVIRVTADAERAWQSLMQEPREDFERQAVERAVKAGGAGAKSDKHISKKRAARRARQ
jgi:hypothetical protein